MDSPLWLAVNSIILVLTTLNLQAVKPCSQNEYKALTETKGHLSSPNFPRYFQKATQCNWLITVAQGYVVTLTFDKFEVGHDAECSNKKSRSNFIEVRDGMEYKNRTIATFCGSSRPKDISSTGNKMWIIYVTSGYRSTKFEAHYSATKDSSEATIILLASCVIIGTILCVSVTIAIIKRKHRNHDDEAGLSPSRDNEAGIHDNRTCALQQIPEFVLGEGSVMRLTTSNEQRSTIRSLLSKNANNHVFDHVDTTDIHFHGECLRHSHDNATSQISLGEHNLAITDVDNDNNDTLHDLTVPIDVYGAESRQSNSGSILTSTKVIFVQNSLSTSDMLYRRQP